jgi:hypothetical protein
VFSFVKCNNFARKCNVNIVLKKRDFVLKNFISTIISEKCNVTASLFGQFPSENEGNCNNFQSTTCTNFPSLMQFHKDQADLVKLELVNLVLEIGAPLHSFHKIAQWATRANSCAPLQNFPKRPH